MVDVSMGFAPPPGAKVKTVTIPAGAPANLPAQEPGDSTRDQAGIASAVHTGEMLSQLFDGNAVIVGGGAYTFTYKAGGGTYVQDSVNGISGDIR